MAGLVPAIPVLTLNEIKTWMPATRLRSLCELRWASSGAPTLLRRSEAAPASRRRERISAKAGKLGHDGSKSNAVGVVPDAGVSSRARNDGVRHMAADDFTRAESADDLVARMERRQFRYVSRSRFRCARSGMLAILNEGCRVAASFPGVPFQ
jgi:hypothetical protein